MIRSAKALLLKLGDLFALGLYSERGRYLLETVAEPMARHPTAFGHALGAADLAVRGAIEVAIAGGPSDERFQGGSPEGKRSWRRAARGGSTNGTPSHHTPAPACEGRSGPCPL